MYSAVELSKLVINACIDQRMPVTNLKLQKILYFMWLDWYRMRKEFLFCDRIEGWHYGPTIPDVYRRYRTFIADPIHRCEESTISGHDALILKELALKYNSVPIGELIAESCKDGSPWDRNGRDKEPFKEISKMLMVDSVSINTMKYM